MAEHLVEKEKAKAKAEAAAKLKSVADKDKRALHSFYFLHSLFTLNDAKNCKDARIDASLRVSVGLEPPPPEPAAGGLPPLLRRRPAALIGPGLGLAMPPCPDGAAHGRLGLRSAARHRRCPRRPHRPGPGTGNAAPPGRCKTQVTRTGARVALGPTGRLPHRLGQGPALPPSPVGARCR